MTEEQTHHPEEPAEGSQEGVGAPKKEEAPARTGDTTAPVNEEQVSEEDAAPAAGPEASPGDAQEDK